MKFLPHLRNLQDLTLTRHIEDKQETACDILNEIASMNGRTERRRDSKKRQILIKELQLLGCFGDPCSEGKHKTIVLKNTNRLGFKRF